MSQLGKYSNSIQDDQLAEFTDQALAGRITQLEANVDEELLALEKTILRLKDAFPPTTLDRSTIKQMQVRFNARAKREVETKQPFWRKWIEPQSRLQLGMAFTAAALLITLAVLVPLTTTVGSSASATALTPMKGTFVVIALAGVILIFLWIKRRK